MKNEQKIDMFARLERNPIFRLIGLLCNLWLAYFLSWHLLFDECPMLKG